MYRSYGQQFSYRPNANCLGKGRTIQKAKKLKHSLSDSHAKQSFNNLDLKVGLVDNEITSSEKLQELATIPSREGLLTMLAGGMIAIPKDLAICLDLHAKNLEENN